MHLAKAEPGHVVIQDATVRRDTSSHGVDKLIRLPRLDDSQVRSVGQDGAGATGEVFTVTDNAVSERCDVFAIGGSWFDRNSRRRDVRLWLGVQGQHAKRGHGHRQCAQVSLWLSEVVLDWFEGSQKSDYRIKVFLAEVSERLAGHDRHAVAVRVGALADGPLELYVSPVVDPTCRSEVWWPRLAKWHRYVRQQVRVAGWREGVVGGVAGRTERADKHFATGDLFLRPGNRRFYDFVARGV